MKILVVEDDSGIAKSLGKLLHAEGYSVEFAARQDDALSMLNACAFDLLLLDITLAQGSGFAVCAAAKEIYPEMPIIFLSASDDEFSTVAGLDMGATDYIAKPFRPRELLSRIKVALRTHKDAPKNAVLAFNDLQLNTSTATLTKNDIEIPLSALEYRLLLYLLQHQGKLITREHLCDAIWDSAGEYMSDNTLNVYIRRLREKIETDPGKPKIITTVRGLGYRVGSS